MGAAGTSKLIDGYNPQNKSHGRLGHGSFCFSYLWANRPYTPLTFERTIAYPARG